MATINVGGVPVFVKTVRLTDLERQPNNLHSTANLFSLPTHYQYGVSSAGFGVWRELASHVMTTGWVQSGACANFPLLYHWRVMPRATSPSPAWEEDVERQVVAWDGSHAIRERLTQCERASASVVLFLEHFPHNLRGWLTAQLASDGASEAALRMVEHNLLEVTSFIGARGLVHFDAHFENILTDGQRLYLSDFGQALSTDFTLTPAESRFHNHHRDFDRHYVVTKLVNFVASASAGASIVQRHDPVAAIMNDFFRRLRAETRATPYPFDALSRAR